jgi:hypothetical protein
MGITKVAPKLTKIETRLGKDGSVQSERIIHPDGHIEYPHQATQRGQETVSDQDTKIAMLEKDIKIAELEKRLKELQS